MKAHLNFNRNKEVDRLKSEIMRDAMSKSPYVNRDIKDREFISKKMNNQTPDSKLKQKSIYKPGYD